MTLVIAALTGPDLTMARSTTANPQAASVPTAYSAVVMPASTRRRTILQRPPNDCFM